MSHVASMQLPEASSCCRHVSKVLQASGHQARHDVDRQQLQLVLTTGKEHADQQM